MDLTRGFLPHARHGVLLLVGDTSNSPDPSGTPNPLTPSGPSPFRGHGGEKRSLSPRSLRHSPYPPLRPRDPDWRCADGPERQTVPYSLCHDPESRPDLSLSRSFPDPPRTWGPARKTSRGDAPGDAATAPPPEDVWNQSLHLDRAHLLWWAESAPTPSPDPPRLTPSSRKTSLPRPCASLRRVLRAGSGRVLREPALILLPPTPTPADGPPLARARESMGSSRQQRD